VKEKVASIFLDTRWEGERWSANAGVRVVHVKSSATGTSRELLSAVKSPNDTTYILNWGPYATKTGGQQLQQLPAVGQREVRREQGHAAAPGRIENGNRPTSARWA
jgi:iron complex outermembrane receptor protein